MLTMRDSTIFYRSFYESVQELPLESQAKIYNAIFNYSLNGNQGELSGIELAIFTLIKPQLDANHKRYENGKKPKGKVEISKTEAKPKQEISKTKANKNVNDNVNKNVNVNQNNNDNQNENNKKEFVPNGTFQTFIEDYSLFFEKKTGIRPKIGSSDGKAANELIEYLTSVSTEKNETGAIESFRFILKEWGKLDNFYGSQIKLIQISSNINNIINQIKNGKSKSTVSQNQQLRDKIRDELADKIRNGSGEATNT